uniref:Set1/Ash2 histone methyltransferase complex subunit ASH2 (Trinotate prediction) n=1 Tax=Henneguya salminicola TaxID=69463 RepID=A0A6G3MHI2_HENSL
MSLEYSVSSEEHTKEKLTQLNIKRAPKKRKSDLNISEGKKSVDCKISTFTVPNQSDFPLNKDGYLYTLAMPDRIAMLSSFNINDYINKPIPGKFYRAYSRGTVGLSYSDKAPNIKLLGDSSIMGQKGYSMIRATHGITSGSYYYEVRILEAPLGSALRIGWSQKYATLQAPVGYDKLSYSWRSLNGTKFHESEGCSFRFVIFYSKSDGYGAGDVLGFFINLPRDKICFYFSIIKRFTTIS